jgi:hypothetical protein
MNRMEIDNEEPWHFHEENSRVGVRRRNWHHARIPDANVAGRILVLDHRPEVSNGT